MTEQTVKSFSKRYFYYGWQMSIRHSLHMMNFSMIHGLRKETPYLILIDNFFTFYDKQPFFGPDHQNLIAMLRAPAIVAPHSLQGQLELYTDSLGIFAGWLPATPAWQPGFPQ